MRDLNDSFLPLEPFNAFDTSKDNHHVIHMQTFNCLKVLKIPIDINYTLYYFSYIKRLNLYLERDIYHLYLSYCILNSVWQRIEIDIGINRSVDIFDHFHHDGNFASYLETFPRLSLLCDKINQSIDRVEKTCASLRLASPDFE